MGQPCNSSWTRSILRTQCRPTRRFANSKMISPQPKLTNAGPAGPAIDLPDSPIVFSGVSFVHEADSGSSDSAGGVRDLDLIIEPGSIVGITGHRAPARRPSLIFSSASIPRRREKSGSAASRCADRFVTAWRNSRKLRRARPFSFPRHDPSELLVGKSRGR